MQTHVYGSWLTCRTPHVLIQLILAAGPEGSVTTQAQEGTMLDPNPGSLLTRPSFLP